MTNLHFTSCHQIPERSFFFNGRQFPICARCTGIYIGYLAMPIFLFNIAEMSLLWAIILTLPTYIDGYIQARFNIESTNMRRLITGIISGVGTMALVAIIGQGAGRYIRNLFF